MKDDLGDRMKLYENMECDRRFMPLLPVVARIDGRSFHTFTKGMDRPYDLGLSEAMLKTTEYLVYHTNACIGYTQSDEITLIWLSEDQNSQIWFDGRISKMTSQLAAQATLEFNKQVEILLPKYLSRRPTFDTRVWQVPNKTEATNVLIWREWDAVKNSISMAASAFYSHKELEGKNGSEKQEMLFQKGVNWNNYPDFFKKGSYVQRRKTLRKFSVEEVENLPLKHAARFNPDLLIHRSEWKHIKDMPIFSKIINREGVVFHGEEPIVK